MLNFEKRISSQKNIFTSLRWYKNEFYDIFGQKKNRYESEKTTIASTSSDFFDGCVKTNSFMSIYIENFAQNSQTHSFLNSDAIFTFSQSKLSKRFQIQSH